MANQYEPMSLSGDDQKIILRRSRASYLSTLCICAFAVLWFVLSVSYWICRSKVDRLLPHLVGVDFVQGTEVLLHIYFVFGPILIVMFPWMILYLSYPVILRLNESGLKYDSYGTSKEITWRDITEIKVWDRASDAEGLGPDVVIIVGYGYRIYIRSVFEIPTRELVQYMNTMLARNAGSDFTQNLSNDSSHYNDSRTNRDRAEIEGLMSRLLMGTTIFVIIGLLVTIIGYFLVLRRL